MMSEVYTLREMANRLTHNLDPVSRADAIYQRLRGLEACQVFIPFDTKGIRGARRYKSDEILRAFLLSRLIEGGCSRCDCIEINNALNRICTSNGNRVSQLSDCAIEICEGKAQKWSLYVTVGRNIHADCRDVSALLTRAENGLESLTSQKIAESVDIYFTLTVRVPNFYEVFG